MESKLEYFGEALEICRKFGLIPIMEHHQKFGETSIAQFFSTLHMETDPINGTLKWMTKNQLLTATWSEFGALLGYPISPKKGANGWRCHFDVYALIFL